MRIECYRLTTDGQFMSTSVPSEPNPDLLQYTKQTRKKKQIIIYYNSEREKRQVLTFVHQVFEPVEDMHIR